MRMDTVFRIYSMTKPITSIAVLMLHERGLLDIDAPVSAYIPEFENLKVYSGENDNKDLILQDMQRQVTITDLLRHTLWPNLRLSGSVTSWRKCMQRRALQMQRISGG